VCTLQARFTQFYSFTMEVELANVPAIPENDSNFTETVTGDIIYAVGAKHALGPFSEGDSSACSSGAEDEELPESVTGASERYKRQYLKYKRLSGMLKKAEQTTMQLEQKCKQLQEEEKRQRERVQALEVELTNARETPSESALTPKNSKTTQTVVKTVDSKTKQQIDEKPIGVTPGVTFIEEQPQEEEEWLTKKLPVLITQNQELGTRAQELAHTLQELQKQLAELSQKRIELQFQTGETAEINKALKDKAIQLSRTHDVLVREREELRTGLDRLGRNLGEREQHIAELKAELGQKTKELGAQIGTAKTLECDIEQKEIMINELKKKIDEHEEELTKQRTIIQANTQSINEHLIKKSELEDSVQSLQGFLTHTAKCSVRKCATCKDIRSRYTLEKCVELAKATNTHAASNPAIAGAIVKSDQQRSLFAKTFGKIFGGGKSSNKAATTSGGSDSKKAKEADKKKSKTAVVPPKDAPSKKQSTVKVADKTDAKK